ncbi:MraY family glycosyltransferase [Fontimonas sp. SYSU GA230001]|uniref:glycosyltransferase family 4 protein n=1 Tax=Fontimonas sp. SYSU GA230001 TaxID=3142450 RepID=UPI0032B42869
MLLVSAACTAALILGRRWHIRLTGDAPDESHHKVHTATVPRVGGIAVYSAGLTGLALLSPTLPDLTAKILWMLWGCLTIVFVAGLMEDLTRAVPAALRYAVAIGAALLFSVAHDGYGISSIGISPFDHAFNLTPIRIGLFAFAVASVSHGFNLIDGQNGLCSGTSILIFTALGTTAAHTGQAPLASLSYGMAAANLGFFAFNFPFGRIFLGDGGAYFNGAVAGAIAVMVVQGSSTVSPWFAVLVLIYPIWETIFSMARRWHASRPFYLPDRDHLHHRLRHRISGVRAAGRDYSSLPILACVAVAAVIASSVGDRTELLLAGITVFVAIYLWAYQNLAPRHAPATTH